MRARLSLLQDEVGSFQREVCIDEDRKIRFFVAVYVGEYDCIAAFLDVAQFSRIT